MIFSKKLKTYIQKSQICKTKGCCSTHVFPSKSQFLDLTTKMILHNAGRTGRVIALLTIHYDSTNLSRIPRLDAIIIPILIIRCLFPSLLLFKTSLLKSRPRNQRSNNEVWYPDYKVSSSPAIVLRDRPKIT